MPEPPPSPVHNFCDLYFPRFQRPLARCRQELTTRLLLSGFDRGAAPHRAVRNTVFLPGQEALHYGGTEPLVEP